MLSLKSLFGVTLATIASLSVNAETLSYDGSWKHQKFPLASSNTFSAQGGSLSISSNDAVSLFYRSVPMALNGAISASWNWKVSASVEATNLRNKGGDDRNIAIYYVFVPTSEATKMAGKSATSILRNKGTKALVYTFGGSDGRGAKYNNPHLAGRGQTIVLRKAGTGSFEEQVNLKNDFQSAFGASDVALIGIAISSDSDDTDGSIAATVSAINLKP